MNEKLLMKMNKVRNNLTSAKAELRMASELLNESIKINDIVFKSEKINVLNDKLNNQIYSLNNKIIPRVKNM